MNSEHSDLNNHHYLLRYLPKSFIPYAQLARIDRPVGFWLLLLPSLWGASLASHLQQSPKTFSIEFCYHILLLFLGALIARSLGCCWNDFSDRKIDPLVERTKNRPIARGAISEKQAIIFMAILFLLTLPIIAILPTSAIYMMPLIASLILIYPFAKRFTFWPQLILGITFNSSLLIGWLLVSESSLFELFSSLTPVLAYLAAVAWTTGYDSIYAYQDIQDDDIIGVKSTPRLFGYSPLPTYSAFIIAGILIYLTMITITSPFIAIISLAPALICEFLILKSWDIKSKKSSLISFKMQVLVGFILWLALVFIDYN